MPKFSISIRKFMLLTFIFVLFNCTYALAEETKAAVEYVTTTNVNFRTGPSTQDDKICLINAGTVLQVNEYNADGWSKISYHESIGYIKTEYIVEKSQYVPGSGSNVELLTWSEMKGIFTIGVDAEVYDVRSGLTYYVRSFSNGNHADVEPVTKEDTAIMKQTYGGKWKWDARPVLVTINGRTVAAAINGMPHGGGVNSQNGMEGQVCIHFKNSKTHNGNTSYEKTLQAAVDEAWNSK